MDTHGTTPTAAEAPDPQSPTESDSETLIGSTTRPIWFHGVQLPAGTLVRIVRFRRDGTAEIMRTDVFGLSKRVATDALDCP
ncbi:MULTISPECIES: hypothetical protein [Nocardia]|uniref:Uncharacterized protein n=4 Tax=Nocardia TaxID=1817 RepID=A0A7G1KFM9_9NOCA|nr:MULTISPECIES: hypothetical protein [Nocardia]MBF6259817.1 hypothetical protein [Nocardia farcinica]MBF6271374.1 hypothetical protein [Nocardia farcinica]MBF6295409.1 hypothetical protein [Nocardia farcinica]MBF6362304.1 hypothetical protein [Nocardia farcinica]MBF6376629.1 hypothetical protein [Nocardia farcinica]